MLMLAPVAPHVAEELWSRLGHAESLAHAPFPVADPAHLVADTVTCVVQVAGKVRGKIEVSPDISDDDLQALALAEPNVVRSIDGRRSARSSCVRPSSSASSSERAGSLARRLGCVHDRRDRH